MENRFFGCNFRSHWFSFYKIHGTVLATSSTTNRGNWPAYNICWPFLHLLHSNDTLEGCLRSPRRTVNNRKPFLMVWIRYLDQIAAHSVSLTSPGATLGWPKFSLYTPMSRKPSTTPYWLPLLLQLVMLVSGVKWVGELRRL